MCSGTATRSATTLVLAAFLLTLPTPAAAQAPQDAPPDWCVPPARSLAAALDVPCNDLLALHAEGVGWGEMMMAYRLGAAWDLDPDELLEHKRSGLGWGKIRHAQALVDAGYAETLAEAADLLRGDADRDDLHEGPPPWAGRPAWAGGPHREGRQDDDARGGPPPWAAGRGNKQTESRGRGR